MTRTKVVTKAIATPATGRTQDSQTSDVRMSSDPGAGDRIEPVRQEHDEEETKYDGPGRDSDGNSSDSEIEESNTEHEQAQRVPDSNQDVPSSTTDVNPDQMAAFTTFMQQMVASMVNAQLAHTAPVGTITRATTPGDVTEAPADQGRPTWTTTTRATRRTNPPASERAVRNQRLAPRPDDDDGGHDDSGGDDSDSDDDDEDEDGDDSDTEVSDDASDTDELGADRRRQRRRTESRGDRAVQRNRRRMIRDLELPVFLPTSTSVSTWISRIDLALEGARLSGRGDWTDQELYYILGNKLQDSAARWWVQLDQHLRKRDRTWTRLKGSLLRRYGERPDKSMAEWRVSQRPMLPGETYADFAASLRDLCGINRVSERVLLAQFYRSIDKTTRQLVRQGPRPKTLEEAVDKATEIDDPIDNVAQGMENIGQAFVTAPSSYLVPAEGTTGQMMMIPGVGSVEATDGKPANFPHPRGAYNKYTGLWEAPKGMQWGGNKWVRATRKRATPVTTTVVGKAPAAHRTEKTAKARMVRMSRDEDSEDDAEAEVTTLPPAKKRKAVVRQVKPVKQPTTGSELQRSTEEEKPAYRRMSERKCFACGNLGHFARECPDEDARARNDEYLARRGIETKPQGNLDRVP